MKKNIIVRILAALGGLLLLALAGIAAAEAFGGVPATATIGSFLRSAAPLAVLGKLAGVLMLAVLAGAAVLCALPAGKPRQTDFVMQKGDDGPIGISVRAIEKLVRTCVAKHDVIADAKISIREARDGIVILLEVDEVSGVSIPLTVELLQRQIRQYVTACTGIAVQEVRVMVENNTENQVISAFAVTDEVFRPVMQQPEEMSVQFPVYPAEEKQEPASVQEPEPEAVQPSPEEAAESAPEEEHVPAEIPEELPEIIAPMEEAYEDERPLHQRVFGAEELPVTVPVPPEMAATEAKEAAEEVQAETEVPDAEESTAHEEEPPAEATEPEEDWCEPEFQAAAEAVLTESDLNMPDAEIEVQKDAGKTDEEAEIPQKV